MLKIIIVVIVIVALGIVGFISYNKTGINSKVVKIPVRQTGTNSIQPSIQPAASPSPIFSYLPFWVPAATWDAAQKATEDTPYGKLTGMQSLGKITGLATFAGRNFEDLDVLYNLGFKTEDIKYAADGPGASQWGYTKVVDGMAESVIFSYSSNALLGPESKSPPFVNISVFISDPFKIEDQK